MCIRDSNWAVLGIGINIAVPEEGFPEEIRSIAGAIFDGPCPVETVSYTHLDVYKRQAVLLQRRARQ